MTPAKDYLSISAPQMAFGATATVSRFLQEAGIWAPPPPPVKGRKQAPGAVPDSRPLPPPLAASDYAPGAQA